MYETFFHLRKKPFELVPDPEFIYLSRSHKKALTYLDYGIRERAGFILLTGEVGSGKTTLIRNLLTKKYERVILATVFNTKVSFEQLLAMINDDFGLSAAGRDKVTLIRDLNDFLVQQYAVGNQPILIIDEAQNLDVKVLEEVRMLSNLESAQSKLLQIILVGQPELRQTLAVPELMQLRQRISINCHLKSLTREELAEYVTHRMEVAGNGSALVFPERSLDLMYKYSRGIPRLINIFCDFIMLAAFAEECNEVSLEMVSDVIGDLDFERHFWGALPEQQPTAAAVTPVVDPEGSRLVTELAQRLEAVERDRSVQVAALKNIFDALNELKQDLAAQKSASEGSVRELRGKVESVCQEWERSEPDPPRGGFARRFWSGMMGGKR